MSEHNLSLNVFIESLSSLMEFRKSINILKLIFHDLNICQKTSKKINSCLQPSHVYHPSFASNVIVSPSLPTFGWRQFKHMFVKHWVSWEICIYLFCPRLEHPSSRSVAIMEWRRHKGMLVDGLQRNPNCLWYKSVNLSKNLVSLVKMECSRYFEKYGKTDVGL